MIKKFSYQIHWIILLTLLFSALPVQTQAADAGEVSAWKGKCACFYQVEKRDTLTKIARIFGIRAQEIADANFITTSTKLKEGQVLCIPRVAFSIVHPKASFQGSVVFNRLFIHGSNFPKEERFIVRIRALDEESFTRIGVLETDEYGEFENNFRISKDYQNTRRFEVCLKHAVKGYQSCIKVRRIFLNR